MSRRSGCRRLKKSVRGGQELHSGIISEMLPRAGAFYRKTEWGGKTYQPNPMGSQVLARNSNSRRSQEDGERTIEEYGKETFPNSAEERQICENIFDWWISGKSYERWYADKFLQGKLFD